ncbi:MAG: DUF5714 domain-containing protein [bacterium]
MEQEKKSGCIVCGKELEYLTEAISATCSYCRKSEKGYFICKERHYVCEDCHKRGALEVITQFCLSSKTTNPLEMADILMKHPSIHMIGPEHHPMIAGILVTAYKNVAGGVDEKAIEEAIKRGSNIPAGYCGLYGTDGVAIACGIAVAIILKATPLSDTERIIANVMTSRVLASIANHRGARCCKRSTYIAIETAIQYFREVLKVKLGYIPSSLLKCEHSSRNKHCNKGDCRFYV